MFGVGRCGGMENTSLISLTSEDRRRGHTWCEHSGAGARAPSDRDCRSCPTEYPVQLSKPRNPWMLAACGVARLSCRVRQVDRLRGSAAWDTGNSSGSRRVAGRCGRSKRAFSRSRLTRACTLPEGRSGRGDTLIIGFSPVEKSQAYPTRRSSGSRLSSRVLRQPGHGDEQDRSQH
jgi:hypothetical protein